MMMMIILLLLMMMMTMMMMMMMMMMMVMVMIFNVEVQDHWDRRSRGDPAVNHDIAYKVHFNHNDNDL